MRVWPSRRWRDVAGELRDRDPAAGARKDGAREGDERPDHKLDMILAREVEPPGDLQPPGGPRSPLRGRPLLVTGATAVATVLVLVAFLPAEGDRDEGESLLRATAAVAAGQALPALGPTQFLYRRSEVWRVAVPGEAVLEAREPRRGSSGLPPSTRVSPPGAAPAGGDPTELVREIWLNERGGGAVEQGFADGEPARTVCSAGDLALGGVGESRAGAFPGLLSCPAFGSTGKVRLLESEPDEASDDGARSGTGEHRALLRRAARLETLRRAVSGRGPLPQRAPRFSELGGGVDELPTDPDRLRARLEAAARREPDQLLTFGAAIGREPAEGAVAKFEVARDMLVNPLAAPEVRAEVFRWAEEVPGLTVTEDVEDPLGRDGAALSVSEEVELIRILEAGQGKLEGSVGDHESRIRREIIFDPESSDILATRVWLEETGNAALAPWLEETGAPAEVEHEVFEPVSVAERPDLAAPPDECLRGGKGVPQEVAPARALSREVLEAVPICE